MAPISEYGRKRIVSMYNNEKLSVLMIKNKLLKEDKIHCSRQSVSKVIAKYVKTGSVKDRPRTGRPSKYSAFEISSAIDREMENNDELTARELQRKLQEIGICLSVPSIKKFR